MLMNLESTWQALLPVVFLHNVHMQDTSQPNNCGCTAQHSTAQSQRKVTDMTSIYASIFTATSMTQDANCGCKHCLHLPICAGDEQVQHLHQAP